MFLKKVKSRGHTYLSLVESYREKNKIKHKTLFSIGREDRVKKNPKLNQILLALTSKKHPLFCLEDLKETKRVNWGAESIYQKIWKELDIDQIFRKIIKTKNIQYDLEKVVFLEVLSRLIDPCSKLKLYENQEYFLNFQTISQHSFYRSLDILSEKKEFFEKELFQRNKKNLKIDIVFYDVTTAYFESKKNCSIKNFGFSKDCKFSDVQIVLGLLIDRDGLAVGYDVFPGNCFEGKTLEKILDSLKKRFQINNLVMVADRGMYSKANLQLIKDKGFDYIVGSRLRNKTKAFQKKILEKSEYSDFSKEISYKKFDYEEDQLYCIWNSKRAKKDRSDRKRLIQKAKDFLLKKTDNNRGAKKYIKQEKKEAFLHEEKILLDEKWDGFYGIRTSKKDLSFSEVLSNYHRLWKIEETIRLFKNHLELRPMFHWTENRIKGHVMICFIALVIQRTLELKLLKIGVKASPEKIRQAIKKLEVSVLNIRGQEHFLYAKIEGLSEKILKLLKIKAPK